MIEFSTFSNRHININKPKTVTAENEERLASHSNKKNLCNGKSFTAGDVLAAVLDSCDDSDRDSEFSDEKSGIDCGDDEIVAGISRIHINEVRYKDTALM